MFLEPLGFGYRNRRAEVKDRRDKNVGRPRRGREPAGFGRLGALRWVPSPQNVARTSRPWEDRGQGARVASVRQRPPRRATSDPGPPADTGRRAGDPLEEARRIMPTFTLTDVSHELWVESLTVDAAELGLAVTSPWSVSKRRLRGGRREGLTSSSWTTVRCGSRSCRPGAWACGRGSTWGTSWAGSRRSPTARSIPGSSTWRRPAAWAGSTASTS